MRDPIQILISDDHTIVRQGLASLLNDQPDMEVVRRPQRPGGGRQSARAQTGCRHPGYRHADHERDRGGQAHQTEASQNQNHHPFHVLHEHYIHDLMETEFRLLAQGRQRPRHRQRRPRRHERRNLPEPVHFQGAGGNLPHPRKATSAEERYKQLSNRERESFS